MKIYILELTSRAEKDLEAYIKSGETKKIEKIYSLFEELEQHPETGTGKPKRLKHEFAGCWSRRIDEKNRLVYKIDEGVVIVTIIAARHHYTD